MIENFVRIDADGDGEISKEEMHQLRKQMGERERDTK
jgi:Ca2+-binding EF-hand superfamily protein